MALEYWFPAFGIGTIADWLAVVVAIWAAAIAAVTALIGIAGAAATVWVALLAHRTSRRATEIADRAAQIAKQQHQEAIDLKDATARIVGRLLLHEVSALPARLHSHAGKLKRVANDWAAGRASFGQLIDTLDEAMVPLMPNADHVQDRIHTLPDSLGADVATMISHCRDIASSASRFRARITELPAAPGIGVKTYNLPSDMGEIVRLYTQVEFVAGLAPQLATEFRSYVLRDGAGEASPTSAQDQQ